VGLSAADAAIGIQRLAKCGGRGGATAAVFAAQRLLLPRHAGGLAAQRGGFLGAVPLADGLPSGEPSQPRCALCALTWLGLGARAKGTASSSPSCPGPPRARRERRARTGGSSRHDRPAGAGVAGAPPGPRRGRLTGHEGRGGRRGMRTLAAGAAATIARGAFPGGGAARTAPAHRPDTLGAQRTGFPGWVRRSRLARRLRRA
jgi:hypothetical protein